VPVGTGLIQCTTSPGELVICGLAPSPSGASLPRADARVLALLQHDSLRSPTPHRPHVSISKVLPSALASCGIPPHTPYGWHLLTTTRERTCRVTPFPVPMVRIRRTVFSTGFLWQCRPVSGFGCRRPILCHFGSSASASCAGSWSRWFLYTFAYAVHRCLLDGIPGWRLPGSAVYPRFSPLRASRRAGGYAVTSAPEGRGIHPHGYGVTRPCGLAACLEVFTSFQPTDRTPRFITYCTSRNRRYPVWPVCSLSMYSLVHGGSSATVR
jgi:hypothetical protein